MSIFNLTLFWSVVGNSSPAPFRGAMTCSVNLSEHLAMSQIAFGVLTEAAIVIRGKNPTASSTTDPEALQQNDSI
jgi:hypothetical protein